MPDLFMLFRGRYFEGEWAELKIGAFLVLAVGTIAAFYTLGIVLFY